MSGEMFLQSLKVGKGGVSMQYVTKVGERKRKPKKAKGAGKLKLEKGAEDQKPAEISQVTEVHQLSCPDEAHGDLYKALEELKQPCLALLELPPRYADELTVVGMHRSEQKGGKIGIVVNLVKTLKASKGRPFNLATPLVVEAEAKPDQEDPWAELFEACDKVIAEAIAYKGGKRSQLSLEFDPTLQKAEEAVGAGAH